MFVPWGQERKSLWCSFHQRGHLLQAPSQECCWGSGASWSLKIHQVQVAWFLNLSSGQAFQSGSVAQQLHMQPWPLIHHHLGTHRLESHLWHQYVPSKLPRIHTPCLLIHTQLQQWYPLHVLMAPLLPQWQSWPCWHQVCPSSQHLLHSVGVVWSWDPPLVDLPSRYWTHTSHRQQLCKRRYPCCQLT